ncbi:hypothetical protein Ancab_033157 [Ancistrocladus abbreviatus]
MTAALMAALMTRNKEHSVPLRSFLIQDQTRRNQGEQVGPLTLGCLMEFGGFSIKQKHAHLMQLEKDKIDISDFSKSPGTVGNSSQRQGQGQEKGGQRSRRLPRRKAIMWEKLSAYKAEHEEPLISGMELNDSHILNMNRMLKVKTKALAFHRKGFGIFYPRLE